MSNTQSWEEIKGWFFVVMFDTKMSHLCSPHKWSLNAIVIPNANANEGYNAMEAFWGKKKNQTCKVLSDSILVQKLDL